MRTLLLFQIFFLWEWIVNSCLTLLLPGCFSHLSLGILYFRVVRPEGPRTAFGSDLILCYQVREDVSWEQNSAPTPRVPPAPGALKTDSFPSVKCKVGS